MGSALSSGGHGFFLCMSFFIFGCLWKNGLGSGSSSAGGGCGVGGPYEGVGVGVGVGGPYEGSGLGSGRGVGVGGGHHEVLLLLLAQARDGKEDRPVGHGKVGAIGGAALAAGADLGRRQPGARRVGRAVELGEAVAVQRAVVAEEAGRERDAEGAGVVEVAERLRLVGLAGARPALDGYLKPCGARCGENKIRNLGPRTCGPSKVKN